MQAEGLESKDVVAEDRGLVVIVVGPAISQYQLGGQRQDMVGLYQLNTDKVCQPGHFSDTGNYQW